MRHIALVFLVAALPFAAQANGDVAHWVQLGPNGEAEARVATKDANCPDITLNGHAAPMTARAPASADFMLTCSVPLSPQTRKASVMGMDLPLPVADPQRILVLGDTGCRIKDDVTQACNDPVRWPFPTLAAAAAKLKPDLVIHVGDYLYRETPCPGAYAGCTGTPYGDNWPTWDADFFAPAQPLLSVAPWVIVRGNHEDCARSGPGWIRLLGPSAFDAAAACSDHFAPYSIPLKAMKLVVMDNANAPETSVVQDEVPVYHDEFAALAANHGTPVWLVMHRPIWGAIKGPMNIPIGGNETLIKAVGRAGIPKPVDLMVSGHIHTFEAINYRSRVPPQIVAGNGGDNLDITPLNLKHAIFQGFSFVTVKDGLSVGGFGFLMMTHAKHGWDVQLYDQAGTPERTCTFAGGRVDCPAAKK